MPRRVLESLLLILAGFACPLAGFAVTGGFMAATLFASGRRRMDFRKMPSRRSRRRTTVYVVWNLGGTRAFDGERF